MRIVLPARAEYVAVVRGVLLVTAGRAGLTIDGGDDLALAVDEMCAALLAAGAHDDLTVSLAAADGKMDVAVTAPVAGDWPPSDWGDSTPALILEALVDDVSFDGTGASASISVSKAGIAA